MKEFRVGQFLVAATLVFITSAGCAKPRADVSAAVVTNERGAAATITTPLERAAQWTTVTFIEMGVRLKEVEMDADARGYLGTRNALNIRAELTRVAEDQTSVLITALPPASAGDVDFARKILEKIVQKRD